MSDLQARAWAHDLARKHIVIWQCSSHPQHRGWRDESRPAELGRRGNCDYCLAMTDFEHELPPLERDP